MRDRTTLDEVRAALESPPPAPVATSGGSLGTAGDPAAATSGGSAVAATPEIAAEAGSHEDVASDAEPATRDAQVRNEPMDRRETSDRGGSTATAHPETASPGPATGAPDSGPENGTAGLSTADMAAAGANDTAEAAGTAVREKDVTTTPPTAQPSGRASDETPLFAPDQASNLRTRWQDIQTGFVDEPRSAVQNADTLVAEAMQQLAAMFANERRSLEQQWSEGQQISTEDLRIALQRYRSFFNRLLSI